MKGITPAHAGTTSLLAILQSFFWDHPRSRGYYITQTISGALKVGSPPLTRVLLVEGEIDALSIRITPAHAGTTVILPTK